MHFLEKWMDQMRGKGFKEENQTDICTEKCAPLHRVLCIPITGCEAENRKSFWERLLFRH